MKKFKNQKGITLVALVVTIIVLLILAGVSLSLVAGSDGILTKASTAVDKNQIASIKEAVNLKVAEEVEKFYEAKYVNRTINTSCTAYEWLSGASNSQPSDVDDADWADEAKGRRVWTEGNNNYEIVYSTVNGKFYVKWVNGTNKYTGEGTNVSGYDFYEELSGTVSSSGSFTWDDDSDSLGLFST